MRRAFPVDRCEGEAQYVETSAGRSSNVSTISSATFDEHSASAVNVSRCHERSAKDDTYRDHGGHRGGAAAMPISGCRTPVETRPKQPFGLVQVEGVTAGRDRQCVEETGRCGYTRSETQRPHTSRLVSCAFAPGR